MKKFELPVERNPQRFTFRLTPELKKSMMKSLSKIKASHPKVKGLSLQWFITQALMNFIRDHG
jgi:hypothetical protein